VAAEAELEEAAEEAVEAEVEMEEAEE